MYLPDYFEFEVVGSPLEYNKYKMERSTALGGWNCYRLNAPDEEGGRLYTSEEIEPMIKRGDWKLLDSLPIEKPAAVPLVQVRIKDTLYTAYDLFDAVKLARAYVQWFEGVQMAARSEVDLEQFEVQP